AETLAAWSSVGVGLSLREAGEQLLDPGASGGAREMDDCVLVEDERAGHRLAIVKRVEAQSPLAVGILEQLERGLMAGARDVDHFDNPRGAPRQHDGVVVGEDGSRGIGGRDAGSIAAGTPDDPRGVTLKTRVE